MIPDTGTAQRVSIWLARVCASLDEYVGMHVARKVVDVLNDGCHTDDERTIDDRNRPRGDCPHGCVERENFESAARPNYRDVVNCVCEQRSEWRRLYDDVWMATG